MEKSSEIAVMATYISSCNNAKMRANHNGNNSYAKKYNVSELATFICFCFDITHLILQKSRLSFFLHYVMLF